MTDCFHFNDIYILGNPRRRLIYTQCSDLQSFVALGSSGTSKWREREQQMMLIRSSDRAELVKCETAGNGSQPVRSPLQAENSDSCRNSKEVLYSKSVHRLTVSDFKVQPPEVKVAQHGARS